MTSRPELVAGRHFALRHHLDLRHEAQPVTEAWVRERTCLYGWAARLEPLEVVCERSAYQRLVARPLSPHLWGEADYPTRTVFIDLDQVPFKGRAELLIAHEVAHHRWPSYRHRAIFFQRCQQLIDIVAADQQITRRNNSSPVRPLQR